MATPDRYCLSGIKEADKIYIGGEKCGKLGRGAEGKSLVIVSTEINNSRISRIRLQQILDASAASVVAAIKKNISPGYTIGTDRWKGYSHLNNHG